MSFNYIENNNEIQEKINTEIINENNDYSNKYNCILNEFHGGTNKEDKLDLEKLIKKFENTNNTKTNSNNKTKINTIFESDNIVNATSESINNNNDDIEISNLNGNINNFNNKNDNSLNNINNNINNNENEDKNL